MVERIVVVGYGAVGRALVARLAARRDEITVIQRKGPRSLPKSVRFVAADVEDEEQAVRGCKGAKIVVCAAGVPYRSAIYVRAWPIIMRNLLTACERWQARFVFADNLYMYGPRTNILTEDTPLTEFGAKPRARAEITRLWLAAHRSGRVQAVAVRASDFYGPDTDTSVISKYGVARLLSGKAALAPYPPDNPHDFSYVPDFARALVSLIDAPEDAYGQAWHVPNAPTRSLREVLTLAANLIGVPSRIRVLPDWLAPLLGAFNPEVRALAEMRFQWDRPYLVDTSRFGQRFWNDATPFEQGLRATIEYYRARAVKR